MKHPKLGLMKEMVPFSNPGTRIRKSKKVSRAKRSWNYGLKGTY